MPEDNPLSLTPPGGIAMAEQITCLDCHDLSLGHSPADAVKDGSTGSYRMLSAGGSYVAGTGDSNYEASGGQNIYDAASMDTFCAACHGGFHETTTPGSTLSGGEWIRHPTDVSTSVLSTDYQGTNSVVPLGDAGNTNHVMCISCHRPHGNTNPDMIRFGYNDGVNNKAGDNLASVGCETCHDYGGSPQDGYYRCPLSPVSRRS